MYLVSSGMEYEKKIVFISILHYLTYYDLHVMRWVNHTPTRVVLGPEVHSMLWHVRKPEPETVTLFLFLFSFPF